MPKLGMEVIRRRQVIDAAIHILQTQGWKDLTIREVSDVAGISTGIVTHYFGSKRSMTLDVIAEANARFERSMRDALRRHSTPTLRLAALIAHMFPTGPRDFPEWSFWLCIWGRVPFDRVIQAETQSSQRRYQEVVQDVIEEGQKGGAFGKSYSAPEAALQLTAEMVGFGFLAQTMPADFTAERTRELLMASVERRLEFRFGPHLATSEIRTRTRSG